MDCTAGSVVDKVNQITQDLIRQEYSPNERAAIGSGADDEEEIRPLEILSRVMASLWPKPSPASRQVRKQRKQDRQRLVRSLKKQKNWKDIAFPIAAQPLEPLTQEKLIQEQWKDDKWGALLKYLAGGILPDEGPVRAWVKEWADDYVVNGGLLCHLWRRVGGPKHQASVVEQVVVPDSLRQQVLIGCHSALDAGHRGRLQTYQKVQERYYWPRMYSDVIEFVRACGVCQMSGAKPPKVPLEGHLQSDIPGARFALDILHVNRQSWGGGNGKQAEYQYILTCVDICSRWAIAVPLTEITSESVLRALVWNVVGPYGLPQEWIVDVGPEFKKHFDQAFTLMGRKIHRSVAYHHEGNGTVERWNRTLCDIIAKMVVEEAKLTAKPWVDLLPWAVLAYNSTVHSALSSHREGITPCSFVLRATVRFGYRLGESYWSLGG